MTIMDGLAAALAIGAMLVVPLGLRCIPMPANALNARLFRAARAGALPAGLLATVAVVLPAGPLAAALVLPWLAVGAATVGTAVLGWLAEWRRFRPDVRHAESFALAFFGVAPLFLIADRLGIQPLGIDSTTVRLTAIHFTFTGFLLPLVGAFAWRLRPSRWLEAALGAVVIGIPITALGFLGFPIMNVVGALAVATGGAGVALGCVVAAGASRAAAARLLLRMGGLSLLLAMTLAAVFALGGFLGQTWLDVAMMARLHGTFNAIGFALSALAAMTIERHRADTGPRAKLVGNGLGVSIASSSR